nr:translation initiation factor IF-2-like [Aegilops tauschii subsp. strangulata]
MTPQPCAREAPSPASARFRWRPACPCAAEWLLLCPRPYVRAFAAAPPVSACRQADAAVPGAFVRLHALHLRLTTCTAPAPAAPCLCGSTSTRTWPPPRAHRCLAVPGRLRVAHAPGSPLRPPAGSSSPRRVLDAASPPPRAPARRIPCLAAPAGCSAPVAGSASRPCVRALRRRPAIPMAPVPSCRLQLDGPAPTRASAAASCGSPPQPAVTAHFGDASLFRGPAPALAGLAYLEAASPLAGLAPP